MFRLPCHMQGATVRLLVYILCFGTDAPGVSMVMACELIHARPPSHTSTIETTTQAARHGAEEKKFTFLKGRRFLRVMMRGGSGRWEGRFVPNHSPILAA